MTTNIRTVETTGSTNADLLAALQSGEEWPHLSGILTRDQNGGRGRLDRAWSAPAGTAVALSVVLHADDIPAERRGWIPLISGLAMSSAIGAQIPDHRVGVKWPNDVLVDGKKICGILSEVATPDRIVIGSGVNTRMTEEQLPVPTATSFAALGVEVDEDRLVSDYLAGLDRLVGALRAGSVRAEVEAGCLTIGQPVVAHLPGGVDLRGTATGLDEDGRLIVGDTPIAAGDVVHLRADDAS